MNTETKVTAINISQKLTDIREELKHKNLVEIFNAFELLIREERDTYWKEQMEKVVLKGERRRIIEQIREERDTYWKERVLTVIDENQGDYESKNPEIGWIKAVPVTSFITL